MVSRRPDGTEEDRRLAERFLDRGDEASFRRLYRRHSPSLNALLLRLLGWNREAAEEALQETWIKAVKGLPGFRWESSLRTWLSGIAIHHCRSLWRRRDLERRLAPDGSDVCEPPARVSESIDLERAISRLPTGYRAVLVLHDLEGYTHRQIAHRLGIRPGTSKSQLSRARAAIRIELSREAAREVKHEEVP